MSEPTTAEVRAWARDNGLPVSDRGRLPAAVLQAYTEAQAPPVSARTARVKARQAGAVVPAAAGFASPAPPSAPPSAAAPTDAWGAPAPAPSAFPAWGQPGFTPLPTEPGRDGLAVPALVFGILPLFGGLLGLVFGVISLRRIRDTHREGKGMAIAGAVLGAAWLLLSIGVAVAAYESRPERDDTGEVTSPGTVTSDKLLVGDCVGSTPTDGLVTSLGVVPCTQVHAGEVFATFTVATGDYPGAAAVDRFAEGGCVERLPGYVGAAAAATYDLYYLSPTEQGWEQFEDRTATCVLVGLADKPLPAGSAQVR